MRKVQAYKCDYCGKCFLRPCNAVQHEASCNANPERRNCKTCVHGCIGLIYYDDPNACYPWSDQEDRQQMVPYCDYHNIPIFQKPYNIDCETSAPPYNPNGEETPDPGTCWDYEYKGKRAWTQKYAPTGAGSAPTEGAKEEG